MRNPQVTYESLLGARLRVPASVVHRTFEAETVLLNLETGRYHGLKGMGGRMLQLLEQSGSAQVMATTVAEECGESLDRVARDVAALCGDLLERGLIEVDDEAS